jgi:hypothetical protein
LGAAIGLGCAPRAAISAESARPLAQDSVLLEISGKRMTVDGQDVTAETLRPALAKRGKATALVLRAGSDADSWLLGEALGSLSALQTTKLRLEIDDVRLEMEREGHLDAKLHATIVVDGEERKIWRVDDTSGKFQDLGGWTPGDPASEQSARDELARACSTDCRVVLEVADKPIVPALRAWQPIGNRLKGSFSVSAQTEPSPANERSGASLGPTRVKGRLAPALIQAVVRANFGELRACYEQGLARNPELRGRLIPRFVIGQYGKVTNVADDGSDVPDEGVRECALRAFYQLTFPAPASGIVIVVYPIQLEPG